MAAEDKEQVNTSFNLKLLPQSVRLYSDKCAEIYTLYLHYHYFLDLKYFLFSYLLSLV